MKPHSFGSAVLLFISSCIFITLTVILLVETVNLEVSYFLFYIIFATFFLAVFSSYRLGHYKPDQLESGRIYVYRGQDKVNSVLFLSEHIHLEIPTDLPTNPNPGNIQETSPVDYDELSLYRGICFSSNIEVGDLVKKHIQDKHIIGVIKIEKEELEQELN